MGLKVPSININGLFQRSLLLHL